MRDGKPVLMRLPKIDFIDDEPGKPVGINLLIGRRPIAAFGNSDGDLARCCNGPRPGDGARLTMIVHHDDAEREYAYGPQGLPTSGGLRQGPRCRRRRAGWIFVSMKADWRTIFPGTAP